MNLVLKCLSVLIFYVVTACSGQSDFGAIDRTSKKVGAQVNGDDDVLESSAINGDEDAEDEEEITAIPPSVISGAYLTCAMDSEDMELACQVWDQDKNLVDPSLVSLKASLSGGSQGSAVTYLSTDSENKVIKFKLEALAWDFDIIFTLEENEKDLAPLTYEVSGEKMAESEGEPLFIDQSEAVVGGDEPSSLGEQKPENPEEEAMPPSEEGSGEEGQAIPPEDLGPPGPSPNLTFSNVSKNGNGHYRILVIQNEGTGGGVATNRSMETALLESLIEDINVDPILGITLEIEYVVQAAFDIDAAKSAALAIWIDHSYQSGGLDDNTVDILQGLYDHGVPLYFIADDIAYSIELNLSGPDKQTQLSQLCHLNSSNVNGSSAVQIELNGTAHPIVDGPYGVVQNFSYNFDPDENVSPIGQGEVVLASRTGGSVALVAYAGAEDKAPVVTQTVLIAGGDAGSVDRDQRITLFKNSIFWFLEPLVVP